MSARVVFRVLPIAPIEQPPYAWKVTRSTAKRQPVNVLRPIMRALSLHRWQWLAILEARRAALRVFNAGGHAQVVIHGKDGRIRTEWTYRDDPPRSKG